MKRARDVAWWLWLLAAVALAGDVRGWKLGLPAAIVLVTLQGVYVACRSRNLLGLAMQVRFVFLLVLILGSWPTLAFLHWLQLAGTTVRIVFDYCLLGRTLSLLPWNRREPLTLDRVRRTFLARPTSDGTLPVLGRGGATLDC